MNEIRKALEAAQFTILHGEAEAQRQGRPRMVQTLQMIDEALSLLPPEGETRRCPACGGNGVIETHPGYAPEGCTLCEGTGVSEPRKQEPRRWKDRATLHESIGLPDGLTFAMCKAPYVIIQYVDKLEELLIAEPAPSSEKAPRVVPARLFADILAPHAVIRQVLAVVGMELEPNALDAMQDELSKPAPEAPK